MNVYSKEELLNHLKSKKLTLKKLHGQNFLVDKNILSKMIENSKIPADDLIIEIGGGFGHLTNYLLTLPNKIVVIEIDRGFHTFLTDYFSTKENKISIVHDDFLKIDLAELLEEHNAKSCSIFSNVPYNITTPILEKCFKHSNIISKMYITVQKEVAERITASQSTKDYGSLTIFCQWHTCIKKLFLIKPNSFFPKPKITSAFLELTIKKRNTSGYNPQKFFDIVHSIFTRRRKTLINSLVNSSLINVSKDIIHNFLIDNQLDENIRGEDLSIKQLENLTEYINLHENR